MKKGNQLYKYKNIILRILYITMTIWSLLLLIIYFMLGVEYILITILPSLLVSFEISCFSNILVLICKIFIKRLGKQNKEFKKELNILKKELGKVAK